MVQTSSPVKVEESKYKDLYEKKVIFDFGTFYIFKEYVIGEISQGEHFTWDLAEKVIQRVYKHFGTQDIQVSYISNRIHSYSVQPQDWVHFFKNRHKVNSVAVVAYNSSGMLSVVLEKLFSLSPMKKFKSLDDAIAWSLKNQEEKIPQKD